MCRAKTKNEVREEFLGSVKRIVDYWARQSDIGIREQCDGVAFSILNILDGTTNLPAMDIVLRPHEKDRAYSQSEDLDWYESGMVINDDCYLHELYVNVK